MTDASAATKDGAPASTATPSTGTSATASGQMMTPDQQMQNQMMAMNAMGGYGTMGMGMGMDMSMANQTMLNNMGMMQGYGMMGMGMNPGMMSQNPMQMHMMGSTAGAGFNSAGYGPGCKYNHPEGFINQTLPDGTVVPREPVPFIGTGSLCAEINSLGYPVRKGQQPCTFFAKTGVCRYGTTCKWDHPEEYVPLAAIHGHKIQFAEYKPVGFNSLGYPLRPGSQACSHYMRTGSCKFEKNCVWDHPENTMAAAMASTTYPSDAAAMAAMMTQMQGYGAVPSTTTTEPRTAPY